MPTEAATPQDLAAVAGETARAHERIDDLPEPTSGTAYDDTLLVAAQQRLEGRTTDLERRATELESRPAGTATVVKEPTKVYFDHDFAGTTDDAKFDSMLAWLATQQPNQPQREIQLSTRLHKFSRQVPTESGGRLLGTLTPAREFGTGCVIQYVGSAPSFFKLQAEPGKYSYPSNGVSRDMHFWGIQFNGGNDKDFLPSAPAGFDSNYVQWYWDFTNCSWVGWDNIVNGWGTGLNIVGLTHFQAQDAPIKLGGSECDFLSEGSLLDSGLLTGDQPAIDWSASKSTIGSAMISARNNSYQMRVTYGHGTTCVGTKFDSSDGAPILGANVRFTGGSDFGFSACSFKGGMGIECLSGAAEIVVENNAFNWTRERVLKCHPNFTGLVKWGFNRYQNGTPPVIIAERPGQVYCTDPRITIKTPAGQVLQAPKA